MANGLPDAGNYIWLEGQQIRPELTRISNTEATITWNIPVKTPETTRAYNGVLILASTKAINPSNYPTDSVKYTASSNFSTPADQIGDAVVVGAFYNDTTTKTMTITGLDPEEVYFVSVHLVTNVRTYYTLGSKTYPEDVVTDAYAPSPINSYEPPTNPTNGMLYFDLDSKTLMSWNGTSWLPVDNHGPRTGDTNPDVGDFVGDIFYNIRLNTLMTWNGAVWVAGEQGVRTPMYNKLGVGTDLSHDERLNLIDIVKKQLGYPSVCVNLTDDHFNIAIDNAIQEARRRLDNAYYKAYIPLLFPAGKQVFYLNDPQISTDKIVEVIKVHRLNLLGLSTVGESGIYAQTFLNQMYFPGASVDLTTIYMLQQYAELFQLIFVGDIAFHWRETTRNLTLFRKVFTNENILLECSMEKTEQELLSDRYMVQWIQSWAESEALLMQGRIRSKYASLPGPGGGLSLNGSDLIAEGQQMQIECLRQIMDFEVGNGGAEFGNYSFTIG